MISADDVRLALTASAVLAHYDWPVKRCGAELESRACPERSDHSRRAFCINANSGRWQCFPCGTSGDLFDFIAGVEGIALPGGFSLVVERAAAIAGVEPSVDAAERAARRAQWTRKRHEIEERESRERADRERAAVPLATAYWEHLLREHHRGLAYLRERAIDDVISVVGDAVRFDPAQGGSPAIALFTSTGDIRNVVVRRMPELGGSKTPGLHRCPTLGTFVNAVCQIEADRDVVLTEGVMDSITARLAWRYAIVLGAHGAGNLADIAKMVIPAVVRVRTRLIRLFPGEGDALGMRPRDYLVSEEQ